MWESKNQVCALVAYDEISFKFFFSLEYILK